MANTRSDSRQGSHSGWLGQGLAGLILGFTLALGVSKLFMLMTPEMVQTARVQLAMWMVMPVWLTVFAISFLWRRALHAWVMLGILNLAVFGLAAI